MSRSIVLTILFIGLFFSVQQISQSQILALNEPERIEFSCSFVDEIPEPECEALVELYTSTSGWNWFNNDGWLQTNTPCSWYGINCQMILEEVNIIWLEENNLQGTIPAKLSMFNLRWLNLSRNQLKGNIPKEIAGANFAQLLLNNNQLVGTLPPEIGQSTSMLALDISHNQLEGELPDSLGQLSNLYNLHLNSNKFYGPLPLSLTNIRDLSFFSFDQTGLCEPQDGGFQFWLLNINTLFSTEKDCGEIRPWTLMYYFATDNDLTKNLDHELGLLKRAADNEFVNIAFFTDRDDENGVSHGAFLESDYAYYHYSEEQSTGKPETLTSFIQWAQKLFPAENYALILIDHSNGISGFGYDDHAPNDATDGCIRYHLPHTLPDNEAGELYPCLTFKEIKTALDPIQKLEVIYLAGCTGASIEAANELKDQMDFFVASEQIAYSDRDHGNYINDDYKIDDVTKAETLALTMSFSYEEEKDLPLTSSVVKMSYLQNVVEATDTLGALLQEKMAINPIIANNLKDIRSDVQHFSNADDLDMDDNDYFYLVDLWDVALKVQERIADQEVYEAADQLIDALQLYVIWHEKRSGIYFNPVYCNDSDPSGECDWELDNSHGVSIYWPDVCGSFYSEEWLDFASGADCVQTQLSRTTSTTATMGWATMLVDYVQATNPDAPINNDPPPLIAPLSTLELSHIPFTSKAYPEIN